MCIYLRLQASNIYAETEKNLSIIYAGAALAKSKGELALQCEKFAREELVKATDSLGCKYPMIFVFKFFVGIDLMTRSLCAAVVNIDEAAETRRVHARVEALSELAQPHQVFWKDKSRARALVQFRDRVEQVHSFFGTCRDKLAMIYQTMFPLNPQPNSLPQLMEKFNDPIVVRTLVRSQLIAGAEVALAFLHDAYPTLDLTLIVTRDGVNAAATQKHVADAALIAVERLEAGEKMHLQSNEGVRS